MHGRARRALGPVQFRRRGRLAVLTLLAVWVGTQAGLARAIDTHLWLRDPFFGDKYATFRRHVAERTTPAGRPFTVVVVGSSRTCFGVRGDVIESQLETRTGRRAAAVNFGIPASGPVTNLLTVRRLLDAGERPDRIVIEVLPPLIADRGSVPAEHPFLLPDRLRREDLDVVAACGFPADELRGPWWDAQLVPWYGYRFPLLGRVAGPWLPWRLRFDCGRVTDPTGWQRPVVDAVTPDGYRRGVAQARKEYFDLLQVLRFDTPAAGAVIKTLAACQECGIPAALLLMPEGTDFRAWYPPQTEAALYAFLRGACRDASAPLIDARRWLADDAFSDAHHMLPDGSARFSERLGRVLADLITAAGSD